jgi:hypothetical protein
MKAKDMAETFKANPTLDTVRDLVTDCILETKTIAEARKIQSDQALRAIIQEVDDKWRALARLCPEIKPDGFKTALHLNIPTSKDIFP